MFSLVASLVLSASPCGPLDLPTVLSLVAQRSDEVAIRRAEVLGAEADVALARALGILPTATATLLVGPAPAAHGSVDRSTYSNRQPFRGLGPFGRVDVNAVQPLYTWGALSAARDAAHAGVKAREALVQDTLREVQTRTIQLYWSVALANRLLAIAADVESALNQAEARIDESLRKGKGDVSQADKYRVQVFRAELLQKRADARKGLQLARAALAGTLELPEPQLELKAEPLPYDEKPAVPTLAQVVAAAEQDRPDVRALDQAILAREAEVRAVEAQRLPMIFVGGTFAYSYAPNRDIQTNPWVSDFFNTLSAGIAIGAREDFSFPTLEAKVDKARAELGALRAQRQGLRTLMEVELQGGVAELQAAADRLQAAHAGLSAGRAWFRSTGLTLGIGVGEPKELVEAYTGYVQTQVNEAQARFDVLMAKARLDSLTGQVQVQGGTQCVLP